MKLIACKTFRIACLYYIASKERWYIVIHLIIWRRFHYLKIRFWNLSITITFKTWEWSVHSSFLSILLSCSFHLMLTLCIVSAILSAQQEQPSWWITQLKCCSFYWIEFYLMGVPNNVKSDFAIGKRFKFVYVKSGCYFCFIKQTFLF